NNMTVYIVLLGIIIGLAVIISCVGANTTRNKQIRKIMFLFLAFIMLFSVMALRGESVGTDNHLYCVIFDNIASGNEIESLNTSQGYILYNRIIALLFGNDSRNLIIISAFIITLIASIFIMKSS